jgi:uncharacterized protein Smg (DUF494 family)
MSDKVTITVTAEHKKELERAAALLDCEDWLEVLAMAGEIVIEYAQQYIKGKEAIVFCKPEFDKLYSENEEFFNALCEEGVVECLTPFVLIKSSQVQP